MVNLNRFSPGSREELLTLLSTALGPSGADKMIRERIRTERLLLNLRRARKRLEAWAADTGGTWSVRTAHRDDGWHAQLVMSFNGNLQETARVADTELGALEAALWDARISTRGRGAPVVITTVVTAAVTAIVFFSMMFALLWVVFE